VVQDSIMTEWKAAIAEQFKDAKDFKYKMLRRGDARIELMAVMTAVDWQLVYEKIVRPFYDRNLSANYEDYVASLPNREQPKHLEEALEKIADGHILLDTGRGIYMFDFRDHPHPEVQEATVETVIQGPLHALTADVEVNVTLLRQRYAWPTVAVEKMHAGTRSNTHVVVMYDTELADPAVVAEIKRRVKEIKIPVLQSIGQMAQYLGDIKRGLFPRLMITERPDRAALNMSQGKVIVLLAGTPFALIAPTTFFDFFSSMEDIYQHYFVSRFLMILRYAAFFLTLTLPASYVAITAYNPEVFRVELALSIAGNRFAVPYPAFMEVLFMMLAMELLVEASIRLPKSIGSAATTVGGLILGTAATEAGLVSSIMIIIVATVAISNFVVPINAMSTAIRVIKYFLLASATLFGLLGLVLGLALLIGYLVSVDSFGQPFLKLFEDDDRHVRLRRGQDGNRGELTGDSK